MSEVEATKKVDKGYAQTMGQLRENLLAELQMLRSGRSSPERAKEVVRLSNSVNELCRTELSLRKAEIELKKEGGLNGFGDRHIGRND
jgi:hypothetical protein